eukprot:360709-Chlamydomonas_euryale.AAC.2
MVTGHQHSGKPRSVAIPSLSSPQITDWSHHCHASVPAAPPRRSSLVEMWCAAVPFRLGGPPLSAGGVAPRPYSSNALLRGCVA